MVSVFMNHPRSLAVRLDKLQPNSLRALHVLARITTTPPVRGMEANVEVPRAFVAPHTDARQTSRLYSSLSLCQPLRSNFSPIGCDLSNPKRISPGKRAH